jgi:splicing factor 3A subunit 3
MSSIPPPPPPPPPPPTQAPATEPSIDAHDLESCRQSLLAVTTRLEQARCKESELEGLLTFSSSLLRNKDETSFVLADDTPGAIRDAWTAVAETSLPDETTPTAPHLLSRAAAAAEPIRLGFGQYAKAVMQGCTGKMLKRSAQVASEIQTERLTEGPTLEAAAKTATSFGRHIWLSVLDQRLQEIQSYHTKHNVDIVSHKRPRFGNPATDGYDLACNVEPPNNNYADAEVMGKYLALEPIYQEALEAFKELFVPETATTTSTSFLYPDFLQLLDKLHTLSESIKLKHRKKYRRWLTQLQDYLQEFSQRTVPLFHVSTCIDPAIQAFETTWKQTGGCPGWEAKPAEAAMISTIPDEAKDTISNSGIDLSSYKTVEELAQQVDGDVLKAELARLGLKCGGAPLDRAKRLFLTKDTPLDKLPRKLFVKTSVASSATDKTLAEDTLAATCNTADRRVDMARTEAIVTALLDHVSPTLEATIRRAERRLIQTLDEQDKEVEEELFGSRTNNPIVKKTDGESDDESDGPIYNPKNVPLDFDGKPIPYWLFKLHGLNHYYPCEICGGESYRGRRNFELHFAEQKHTLSMRSLGIPNTKHFHGITSIDDAQQLWDSLQGKLQHEQFDNAQEEEYEDSNGNVLSRTAYEELARQGRL